MRAVLRRFVESTFRAVCYQVCFHQLRSGFIIQTDQFDMNTQH